MAKRAHGFKILLTEYREAFLLFDRNNDGRIAAKELGRIMRSVGLNPTDAMVQLKINEVDYDGKFWLLIIERPTHKTISISIYKLCDVDISSNLIGSLSLTNGRWPV